MKIKELIIQLQNLDPDAEIRVLFPLPNRPIGGTLEPIHSIKLLIDQDTNWPNYAIDTGIGEDERYYKSSKS